MQRTPRAALCGGWSDLVVGLIGDASKCGLKRGLQHTRQACAGRLPYIACALTLVWHAPRPYQVMAGLSDEQRAEVLAARTQALDMDDGDDDMDEVGVTSVIALIAFAIPHK